MCWDAVWWMGDAWYDVLRCSVMNGWCTVGCSVWWMGDAWVLHEWCDVLYEWMNGWINEWMMNAWAYGQCRMTVCILLYFICICNMSLYLFRAISLTNKPLYTPGQVFVILHTNPTCNMKLRRTWGVMRYIKRLSDGDTTDSLRPITGYPTPLCTNGRIVKSAFYKKKSTHD